jgi:hypothetical protein
MGGYMKYLRRFGLFLSAIILFTGAFATTSSAQRRVVVVRPVIRSGFFYDRPYWGYGYYDPFYNPYYYDPYLQYQREKYYDQKSVNDANKKLSKDRAKFNSDGVMTAKEQEKLMKDREKYSKAVRRLNELNRSS